MELVVIQRLPKDDLFNYIASILSIVGHHCLAN